MIRILIADDHPIFLGGLLQLFGLTSDMTVVGQATNGRQLIELLRTVSCDLVLLDLSMPGICGMDLIGRIRARAPLLPILVLSMHNEVLMVRRALNAGANGYATKDGDPEMLLLAVRKVAGGGHYIDSGLAEQLVFASECKRLERPHERLSNRELSIFSLFVSGKRVKQIADELAISDKTVSTHKARLMRKMQFQNSAEMLRYGIDNGLHKQG